MLIGASAELSMQLAGPFRLHPVNHKFGFGAQTDVRGRYGLTE